MIQGWLRSPGTLREVDLADMGGPRPPSYRSSSAKTSTASRASTCRRTACSCRGAGSTSLAAQGPIHLTCRRSSGTGAGELIPHDPAHPDFSPPAHSSAFSAHTVPYAATKRPRHVPRLTAMQDRGIEPMVTLLHYEEPLWVSEQNSWVNASTVDDWLDFVRFVGAEFGGLVDTWVTLNEPFVMAGLGYLEGRCARLAQSVLPRPASGSALCLDHAPVPLPLRTLPRLAAGGHPAARCS